MTRTGIRCTGIVALGALAALIPAIAAAQRLAPGAARVTNGTVRMSFAARAGVCGDGGSVVAFAGRLMIHPSIDGYGTVGNMDCRTGPVRVALTFRDGALAGVRTHVGGDWRRPDGDVTDLGEVQATDAADYLLDLARLATGQAARDVMLPAVLADGADVVPTLMDMARDRSLPAPARRQAIQWVGALGDETDVSSLARIARDTAEEQTVREGGLVALAQLPGGREAVLQIVLDDASDRVKSAAILALGHHGGKPEDGVLLRELYGRLESRQVRASVIQSLGQIEHDAATTRWLVTRALDDAEPMQLRRDALFWAGEAGIPTDELVGLHGRITDRALAEHYLFVLAEREDDAATEKLIDIARRDPDREMRKKALFWLAEKDDPRVMRLIADLINR